MFVFWLTLCQFCLKRLELNNCCPAQCVLCRRQSAHQVLVVVVPSLVISSPCARDCVFMTRDMLRIMAQENLMCSSRPTIFIFSCFPFFFSFLIFIFLQFIIFSLSHKSFGSFSFLFFILIFSLNIFPFSIFSFFFFFSTQLKGKVRIKKKRGQ